MAGRAPIRRANAAPRIVHDRPPAVEACVGMGVADIDTTIAVAMRDDLAVWTRLNVTAFLISSRPPAPTRQRLIHTDAWVGARPG